MILRFTSCILFISVLSLVSSPAAFSGETWPLNNISEGTVNDIFQNVIALYELEIKNLKAPLEFSYKHSDHIPTPLVSSAELTIKERWDEASQSSKVYYKMNLLGVFSRISTMTEDGIALILCHELGHILGGTPTFLQIYPGLDSALSSEGQADYFAATSCFRKYARKVDQAIDQAESVASIVKDKCTEKYQVNNKEVQVCIRTALAGKAVLTSLNKIRTLQGKDPDFFDFKTPSTFDQKQTGSTLLTHPDFQCRLDTFMNGALCEYESGCNSGVGQRPACWFVQ